MTLRDLSWWIFGCGFGAVAGMFLTAFMAVRDFEKDDRPGGYRSGVKPVSEYRQPPAGPAPGAKR